MYEIEDLPITDGFISVSDLLEWVQCRDAGCAEYLADELLSYLDSIQGMCECHERDSSYVCEHCRLKGFRGHMER